MTETAESRGELLINTTYNRRSVLKNTGLILSTAGLMSLTGTEAFASLSLQPDQYNKPDDFSTWNQNKGEWGATTYSLVPGNGWTMATAGCAIFSGAFIKRKSGVRGKGYTPITLLQEAKKSGYSGGDSYIMSNGLANFTALDSKIEYGGAEVYAPEFSPPGSGLTGKKAIDRLTALHKEGYFMILNVCAAAGPKTGGGVPNHYIAVDRPKDGDIIVMDPGLESIKLSEVYAAGSTGSVLTIHKYKVKGVSPDKVDLYNKNGGGNSGPSDSSSSSEDVAQGASVERPVAKEWDLKGLKGNDEKYFAHVQTMPALPASSTVTGQDNALIQEIGADIKNSQASTIPGVLQTGFSVVGFIFMMLGVLHLLLGLSDINTGTRFIPSATGGKRVYSSTGEEGTKGIPHLVIWSIVLMLIGGLVVSGDSFGWMYGIYKFVVELIPVLNPTS